jgi:hypothetical protein
MEYAASAACTPETEVVHVADRIVKPLFTEMHAEYAV